MNKIYFILLISFMCSLQIIDVQANVYEMYEIDLRTCITTKYDFYLKNFARMVHWVPPIIPFNFPIKIFQRYVCIYYNHFTKNLLRTCFFFRMF